MNSYTKKAIEMSFTAGGAIGLCFLGAWFIPSLLGQPNGGVIQGLEGGLVYGLVFSFIFLTLSLFLTIRYHLEHEYEATKK